MTAFRIIFLTILAAISLDAAPACAAEFTDWTGYPPLNEIRDLAVLNGYVYAVTAGGFYRYDPVERTYRTYYKNSGLPDNNVRCLAVSGGYIYLGFQEIGLWRYDPASERFSQVLFPEYHVKTTTNPSGISLNAIQAVGDSVLYIAHSIGVDYLNLATEELRAYGSLGGFPAATPVNEVRVFDGRIWACTDFGLAVANAGDPNLEFPDPWTTYPYRVGGVTVAILSVMRVTDAYDDRVYLGSDGRGVLLLNENTGRIEPTSLMSDTIVRLGHGLGRSIAIGSYGIYSKQVHEWKMWNDTYSGLTAFAPEADRTLWAGTLRSGLQALADSAGTFVWKPMEQPTGVRNSTFRTLAVQDGVVWAGTNFRDVTAASFFHRLENNEWSVYHPTTWPWTNYVTDILTDNVGRVWMSIYGTNPTNRTSGVYILEDDGTPDMTADTAIPVDPTHEIFRPTITNYFVVCTGIDQDDTGNIWVANLQVDPPDHAIEAVPSSGIVVVDGYPITKYQHYSPAADGLPTALIYTVCADRDGWVWAGTDNKGLIGVYVGPDPYDKADTIVRQLTTNDGLHGMRITALAEAPNGDILVGTEGGINLIEKKSNHQLTVKDLNTTLENVATMVNGFAVDPGGTTWVATAGGIVRLDTNFVPVVSYTLENSGLFSNVVFSLAWDGSTGVLWIGTDVGLNRFDTRGSGSALGEIVHVYPNPFEIWGTNSVATFSNLQPGSVLTVFTFNGEQVTKLTAGESTGERAGEVDWGGTNIQGETVGSGIFYFTGKDGRGKAFTDKLAVIRR